MLSDMVMFVLEVIGTVSFAISGALVAIKARLDIFGIIIIGFITALGGGMLRDVLIGRLPPAVFTNGSIVIIAVATAVIVFLIARLNIKRFRRMQGSIEYINNFFDAIGLAAFSVMGTEVAFTAGVSDNMFLSVCLGVVTGVGGGVFRDVLTDTTPYIFKKHVYALASVLGSCLYYSLRVSCDGTILASVSAMVLIIGIRLLATKYRWSLPRIKE